MPPCRMSFFSPCIYLLFIIKSACIFFPPVHSWFDSDIFSTCIDFQFKTSFHSIYLNLLPNVFLMVFIHFVKGCILWDFLLFLFNLLIKHTLGSLSTLHYMFLYIRLVFCCCLCVVFLHFNTSEAADTLWATTTTTTNNGGIPS